MPKLREFDHYESKTLFRLLNRDKMNNRLKARRYQLTRRLIRNQSGESLEITQGEKNLLMPSKKVNHQKL